MAAVEGVVATCDVPAGGADLRGLIGRLPITGFDTMFASGSTLREVPVAREPPRLWLVGARAGFFGIWIGCGRFVGRAGA